MASQSDFPRFQITPCKSDAELCVRVTFPDGVEDLIEANEYHGERHKYHDVFKGRLASSNAKSVVIMNQDPEGKDLVVFKSGKIASCTRFRVDLEGNGEVSCSPGPTWHSDTDEGEPEQLLPPIEANRINIESLRNSNEIAGVTLCQEIK